MADPVSDHRLQLFEELARTGSVDVRNELVESFAPLAEFFANRYRRKVDGGDDLGQVAQLALVKAVDRFDHTLGVQFSTFAGRTIDGELKRYFRDRTWSVRVPRSLQQVAVEIRALGDEMAVDLGRSPTVPELSKRSGHDEDVIVRALDVHLAKTASSIDGHATDGDDDAPRTPLAAALGAEDDNFARTDTRLSMRSLLDRLDERERTIVELRFFDELTQQEIAERVGVSQMHVSRLLRSALEKLRRHYSR